MEKVQWARVGRAVLGEVAERLREMAEGYAQRLTAGSLERKEKKRGDAGGQGSKKKRGGGVKVAIGGGVTGEKEGGEEVSELVREERRRERELLLREAKHVEALMGRLEKVAGQADGEEKVEEVVEYALSRLEKGYYPPKMVANTLPKHRAALGKRKSELQRLFLTLFGVGATGFFIILVFVVWASMKAARAAAWERERLMEGIEEGVGWGETEREKDGESEGEGEREGGSEGDGERDGAGAGDRVGDREGDDVHRTEIGARRKVGGWRMGVQIGILVAVVVFTVVSVIVLGANLVWQI